MSPGEFMTAQNESKTGCTALLEQVQLQHRDDFDTAALPLIFYREATERDKPNSFLSRLQDVAAEYYPWIPEFTFEETVTKLKSDFEELSIDEAEPQTAVIFCVVLRGIYDRWVAADPENATSMFLAEHDVEELYEIAERTTRTDTIRGQENLKVHIERAQRQFIPDDRIYSVVRIAGHTPDANTV